jgi:hypothetical protein
MDEFPACQVKGKGYLMMNSGLKTGKKKARVA